MDRCSTVTGMATNHRPIVHRDGRVSIDGKVVGVIVRKVEPVGPVRRNGTRRHVATFTAHSVGGPPIGAAFWNRARAVDDIVAAASRG